MRRRLGLEDKRITLEDHFILVSKNDQSYILVVDEVSEVYSTDNAEVIRKNFAVPTKEKHSPTDTGLELMIFNNEKLGIVLIYNIENLINTAIELDIKAIVNKLKH